MNKKNLSDIVSENTGLAKKETQCFVNSAINVMINSLGKGAKVQLTGFGTFSVLSRKAKKGINPVTKAEFF